MELPPLIHDLAVLLAVAAAAAFIFHRLKLPVLLGYVVAGIAINSATPLFPSISDLPNIRVWGELGVVFLMFTLGLDFSFRRLMAVGVRAAFTGVFEVACMTVAGFALGRLLGWGDYASLFLGGTVAISSTTILIKSLRDLGLRKRRFADMVFGILIIEDLIAVLILVALSSIATRGDIEGLGLILLLLRLLLVVACWMLVGFLLVPRFLKWAARVGGEELLTILSIALCLLLVTVGAHFGYSPALGAFIMGSIIGETREARLVERLIHPMRDLFVAVFFVSVGLLVDPKVLISEAPTIAAITALVLIGKITFVTIGSVLAGRAPRHALQTALSMAQIGEFSFLIAGLGAGLVATRPGFQGIVVAVSLVTTLTTPFLLRASDHVVNLYENRMPEHLKQSFERYALALHTGDAMKNLNARFGRPLLRWIANGALVTAVFIVSADHFLPWAEDRIAERMISHSAAWLATCLVAAPFLWAMATVFHGPRSTDTRVLFLSRVLTAVWLGALSAQFLSAWTTLAVTAAGVTVLTLLFYRRIEASYDWIETKFLDSFKPQEDESQKRRAAMDRLAPWDAHLIQINVHSDSDVVGRTLIEAKLRERFGLNVVAIQRGSRVIVAPPRDERVYPGDELLVLATEDQIEAARRVVEGTGATSHGSHDLTDFELKAVLVEEESSFCRKSILASQIRERYGALVVGVERQGRRIMNPPSQLVLSPGDRVWLVGDRGRLRTLAEEHRALNGPS